MKTKRKLGRLALIALIVGGVSSIATASVITQAVQGAWTSTNTWVGGGVPVDSIDSVVIGLTNTNADVDFVTNFVVGADQSITQQSALYGGYFRHNGGTLDVFGSVNWLPKGRHYQMSSTSQEKTVILRSGSTFTVGAEYRVAYTNATTKWFANSNGVTIVEASAAELNGSAAIIDLTDYDLAESGSTVLLMKTKEKPGHTFASVTLIPTNLLADVDYAYSNDTYIALTDLREFAPATETAFLDPDPSVINLAIHVPATTVTGSVDLVYTSHTNVNLTVTISEENYPGSFSVITANPQVLDPQDYRTTVPVVLQFDNSIANLPANRTATGLVTFAWSDNVTNGSFNVPFSIVNPSPEVIGRWVAGTTGYNDKSGYTPAGTHDGAIVVGTGGGAGFFTNDVPPDATGSSLYLTNSCLVIGNTRTNNAEYVNTFDENISKRFSVTFWAKGYPETGGSWTPSFVSKGGENNGGWQIRRKGDMKPLFTLRGSAGGADAFGALAVTHTNWHHYAATWDGVTGTRRLYIDGAVSLELLNDTGTLLMDKLAHLVIGAREGWGSGIPDKFVQGVTFFDVRMYNAALNQSEVEDSMIQGEIDDDVIPTLSIDVVTDQVVVTWDVGTLLETTNLQAGSWTTNAAAESPYQVDPATPVKFFKVQNP